jgi:hypothetical protein
LRQEEKKNKEGENSRFDKKECTLLNGLKRLAISRPSVTQD